MKLVVFLASTALACAQTQIKPIVSQRTVNEQVNIVRLAPRYATAIRLPEAVSSVVVGDPVKFLAEHSDKEPKLVLVKPVSEDVAESNLLVTTVMGRHLSFLLRSEGGVSAAARGLRCELPARGFLPGRGEWRRDRRSFRNGSARTDATSRCFGTDAKRISSAGQTGDR